MRHRLAWMVAAVLLFQQLALAAYACPISDARPSTGPAESAMLDCADMAKGTVALDPQAPALCSLDCQNGHAVRASDVAQQVAVPLALAVYIVPADQLLIPPDKVNFHSVPAAHADPPLTQRFCRLLI